jgi:hypothetical protein
VLARGTGRPQPELDWVPALGRRPVVRARARGGHCRPGAWRKELTTATRTRSGREASCSSSDAEMELRGAGAEGRGGAMDELGAQTCLLADAGGSSRAWGREHVWGSSGLARHGERERSLLLARCAREACRSAGRKTQGKPAGDLWRHGQLRELGRRLGRPRAGHWEGRGRRPRREQGREGATEVAMGAPLLLRGIKEEEAECAGL